MQLRSAYPIAVICEVLDYPRSQVYYQAQAEVDESDLKAVIGVLAGRYPRYGYRRITEQLKREGYAVNHKRVLRLMREMGIEGKLPRKRKRTTNSQHGYGRHPNLVLSLKIERINQVWVGDITYIRLQDEFVYLAVLMDVFTRSIRGWHLARTMDQSLTLVALEKGFQQGCPEIHHSDQGVQYAATEYVKQLKSRGVPINMADVGAAWQNGYAERLMRTIKEGDVHLSEYRTLRKCMNRLGGFWKTST